MKDKRFLIIEQKIRKRIDALYDKYVYEEKVIKMITSPNGTRPVWRSTGRKYLPEVDDVVTVPGSVGNVAETRPGLWNKYINAYWNEMVKEYDTMFAMLNHLISEMNYFKMVLRYLE